MGIRQYSGSLKALLYHLSSSQFPYHGSGTKVKLIFLNSIEQGNANDSFLFGAQLSIEQCLQMQNIELVRLDEVDSQNLTGKLFAYLNDLIYRQATLEDGNKIMVVIHGLLERFTLQFGELIDYHERNEYNGNLTLISRSHYSARYLGLLMNRLLALSELPSVNQVALNDHGDIIERAPLVFLPLNDTKSSPFVVDFDELQSQIQQNFLEKETYVSLKHVLVAFKLESLEGDQAHITIS